MTFKKHKILASIICIVILVPFLFAGCSTNKPSEDSSTNTPTTEPTVAPEVTVAPADEEINISFTWWGDTKRNEIYNGIVDLFEEANPNIKVDRPFGSWTEYWDKLATQIAGGNAPDVIGMHQDYVSEYGPRGSLLDLKPYVDSGVLDLSAVPESVVKGGYINGKLMMVAQGVVTSGIFYNTATFDELGVAYPDMDWTWEEYADKLAEIKAAADAKGIEMWAGGDDSGSMIPAFHYWIRSYGQQLFTEDGNIGFTEDAVADWFNFYKDLRDKDLIPDAATGVEYSGLPLEQSLFNTGKTALQVVPANQVWLYQNQVTNGGDINVVRIPHLAGKADGEYVEGSFLSVTSASKNPEAAAKLISFFINNTESQKLFKLEQGVPATTTAIDVITADLTPPQVRTINFVSDTLAIAGNAPYAPTGVAEIRSTLTEIGQAVAFGTSTPEEAAAEFIKICNEVLTRQ